MAIALGVARLVGEGASGEDLVLVCPCDHAVAHVDRFVEAVALARQAAAFMNGRRTQATRTQSLLRQRLSITAAS